MMCYWTKLHSTRQGLCFASFDSLAVLFYFFILFFTKIDCDYKVILGQQFAMDYLSSPIVESDLTFLLQTLRCLRPQPCSRLASQQAWVIHQGAVQELGSHMPCWNFSRVILRDYLYWFFIQQIELNNIINFQGFFNVVLLKDCGLYSQVALLKSL